MTRPSQLDSATETRLSVAIGKRYRTGGDLGETRGRRSSGGIVTQVGDLVYDGSIATELPAATAGCKAGRDPDPTRRPAASSASPSRFIDASGVSQPTTREDNVGVALLGNYELVREGDVVKRTGRSPRCRSARRCSAAWSTPSASPIDGKARSTPS